VDVFKNLDEILKHLEIVPFLGGQIRIQIDKTIAIIKGHIDDDIPKKNFNQEDIDHVLSSSRLMSSLMIEREVKKTIEINFLRNFVYMLYNWNQNYEVDPEIEKNCVFVQNYLDDSMSLSEVLQTLKTMTARLELGTKADLPSFKLSDHYYKIIKRESEDEFFMASGPTGR